METHVCPVWIGYLLLSPVRKLFQNPYQILNPYVKSGMSVLDIGSAMGYFSLPLAEMVEENGRVICVDLQKKMLEKLEKRSKKAGLADRIVPHLCSSDSLRLESYNGTIDFALAFAMVHEAPNPDKLFSDIFYSLKNGAGLLVAEPKGHVDEAAFTKTISLAEKNHFIFISRPSIAKSHSAYFIKM